MRNVGEISIFFPSYNLNKPFLDSFDVTSFQQKLKINTTKVSEEGPALLKTTLSLPTKVQLMSYSY